MKKIFILSIMLASMFYMCRFSYSQMVTYPSSWGKQGFSIQEETKSKVIINYSLTEFYFEDIDIKGINARAIKVPGIFLPNDEGAPDLPGSGRYIVIPEGANVSLNITATRVEKMQDVTIAPAPKIPLDTDQGPLQYEKDLDIYLRDAYYPEKPVKVSSQSNLRGIDVVMLGITPFQYNPVTKELLIYRDLRVELSFTGGTGQFGDERLRSRWWDPILKSTVLNHNSIPEVNYNNRQTNSETLDYEYLIITVDDPDFLYWANTIKTWRSEQGIKTGVVTTAEIGGNTVSAIEAYVDNAYNTWDVPPAAVLLLGDYSTGSGGITSFIYPHPSGYPDFASDNRFADVGGDDLPDIIFARITANNASQLEVMVTKFINYESNPPTATDFYNHPITALGWQTTRWFQICSEVVGGYLTNVHGKNPVRINAIYSGNPSSDPWSTATNTATVVNYFGPDGLGYIPATPQGLGGFSGGTGSDVINAINAGSYMLQHRDHGGYTGWGEPAFGSSSIDYLTNVNNKLPFIFSINCQTGAFHRSSECFAEKFHRHTYNGQNSGALGIIAATEVSYSFVNDTYVWGVFDNMFPDFMPDYSTEFPVNYVMPAFANAGGKYFLYQSNWPYNTSSKQITYRLFHHHGGAFMTVYTEVPQNLSVSHASSMLSTATSFTVTADAGSLIGLTVNGEIIGTADGTGSPVDISILPQTPGSTMLVTVTKQNYYRYSSSVNITSGGVLADFTADLTTVCTGQTVVFTDQSSGSPTSWAWTVTDGTPSAYGLQGPVSVTYNAPGTYSVSLTVSDGTTNDTETKAAYITVNGLTADFSGDPATLVAGGSVNFTDLSTCNPTSWSWSFPGGDPASSNDQNPSAITYDTPGTYTVSLIVGDGSGTDTKEILDYITVTDIQYCTSHGNAIEDWIDYLNIDGTYNFSGSSGATGYEDFTGFVFSFESGSTVPVILTPGFAIRAKFQYWRVWIDFNNDGDFTDAGEEVFAPNKKKTAVSGTITIPPGLNTTTRMRISMKRSAIPLSCEIFSVGEVEDYTVILSAPVPQPPVADFTSDKTNIGIGETVQFTDQSANIPTSWSWSFTGGTPNSSTSQDPSIIYNAIGTYDVSLTATNAQGSDAITKTAYIVVSDNPPPQYCVPVVSNLDDYINSITIGTVTHNSQQGVSGYTYYTSPSFTFTPGNTYSVSLSPFNASNKNFWRIWIDFNNNGLFTDAGETVLTANNKKGTVTGNITIPLGVDAVSPDRMRITMKTGSSPGPCDIGFNGEVEDYDVNYSAGGDLLSPVLPESLDVHIYPNPAKDLLHIRVAGNSGNVSVKIYNTMGSIIDSYIQDKPDTQIDISNYSPGLYFIYVNDDDKMVLQKFVVK